MACLKEQPWLVPLAGWQLLGRQSRQGEDCEACGELISPVITA
jgi:hypothetical protein